MTNGKKSILKENQIATAAMLEHRSAMSRHKRLCWKCQKDKLTFGGSQKMMSGFTSNSPNRFICKDCIDAKVKEVASK